MSTSRALEDLSLAAAAAGFAMAGMEDETLDTAAKPFGDEVARGERLPVLSLSNQSSQSARSQGTGLVAGAQHVREALFGYLGLGATA